MYSIVVGIVLWVHLTYWIWVLVLFSPNPLLFFIIWTVLNINGQLAHNTRFLLILYMPQICLEKDNQSKYFMLSQQFKLTVFHGLHAGKVHYNRHKHNLHFISFYGSHKNNRAFCTNCFSNKNRCQKNKSQFTEWGVSFFFLSPDLFFLFKITQTTFF